jgi:hypothetical protein
MIDWWKKDTDYTEGIVKLINQLDLPFFVTHTSSSAYAQGFCWISTEYIYMRKPNHAVSPIFPTSAEALVDLYEKIGKEYVYLSNNSPF